MMRCTACHGEGIRFRPERDGTWLLLVRYVLEQCAACLGQGVELEDEITRTGRPIDGAKLK